MDQLEERRYLETFIGNPPGFAYRHRNVPGWPLELIKGDHEAVTGYTVEEAIETVEWAEELIHPGDRRYVRRAVDQGLSDTGRYELTYRIVTKEGASALG